MVTGLDLKSSAISRAGSNPAVDVYWILKYVLVSKSCARIQASMAQSAARGSHNPKVVSSSLTVRIFHSLATVWAAEKNSRTEGFEPSREITPA